MTPAVGLLLLLLLLSSLNAALNVYLHSPICTCKL
jgi:hypothetical protein